MTAFSDAIKQEIKKSKKTLLYLADASGLSLDHISKMRLGKRLPQDENKMKLLIAALECSEQVQEQLYSLYKIEKMGKSEWDCMQEMKRLLEFQGEFGQQNKVWKSAGEDHLRETAVLNNRGEIYDFLLCVMNSRWQIKDGKPGKLYMMTGMLPEDMVNLLVACFSRYPFLCEHCFSLCRNTSTEATLYNLRFLNQILPMIQVNDRYVPVYEYTELGAGNVRSCFVGESWALELNRDMTGGIVIWNPEQITFIKSYIRDICRDGRKLVSWYQSPEEWVGDLCQYREYMKDEKRLQFTKEAGKTYYLEPSPCLIFLMPESMLQKHILGDEQKRQHLMVLLERRRGQILEEDMVNFFTLEGVERFAEEGRLSGIPDWMYEPFSPEERREILERYVEWMEQHEREYYVIDSRALRLAPHMSLYSTSSMVNNAVSMCMSLGNQTYCMIQEQGISQKINQLMRLMETGEFICEKEKGIQEVKRILKQM